MKPTATKILRVVERVAQAYLLVLLVFMVLDALASAGLFAANFSCDTVVVDTYSLLPDDFGGDGVCVVKGLTLWEALGLGHARAKRIIIVSHGFRDVNGVAVGLSERFTIPFVMMHPLAAITRTVVGGVTTTGERYAAVMIDSPLVASLEGKEVVLITCGSGSYLDRAVAVLISKGASMVAIPQTAEVPYGSVTQYVRWAVTNPCGSDLFICTRAPSTSP